MATITRNLPILLNKSVFSNCKCCGNVIRQRTPNFASRFISHQQRYNHQFSFNKRVIYGFGVASLVGSSAWLLSLSKTKLSWKDGSYMTVSAIEPLSNANDAPDKLRPRQKWNFVADVVDMAAPAVVHISIKMRDPYTGQKTTTSNGSGFIVREDGLILTNAHVVANKSSIEVRLNNGQSYNAQVQAMDPISDLATLKIDAKNLPTLKLGQSSSLRTGEWVVALGSPLQLSNTVTAGIISQTSRGSAELGMHNKDMDYIQTDAVISFGNSGGPLVNLDGEAIGINSMKVTTGISFAIPSDYARDFLEKAEKIEKRSDSKGFFGSKTATPRKKYLGITMLTLTPSLIKDIRLRQEFPDVSHGVLVYRLIMGSPAHAGGMLSGDVILKINGNDVKTSSDVYKAVESSDDLKIEVQRGSRVKTLNIKPDLEDIIT